MRKILYAFALMALAAPVFASDPFAGTWKLNSAKTKYTSGAPPKELTAVIEEQGTDLQVTATGMYESGTPLSVKYTIPMSGGTGKVQTGDFDGITSKMQGAKVRLNTYMKDGKALRTRRMVLSADGKTMQTTVKGTGAEGKPVSGMEFFDKE